MSNGNNLALVTGDGGFIGGHLVRPLVESLSVGLEDMYLWIFEEMVKSGRYATGGLSVVG